MLEAYDILVRLAQAELTSAPEGESPSTLPLLAVLSEAMQLKAGLLSRQLTGDGRKEAGKKLQVPCSSLCLCGI